MENQGRVHLLVSGRVQGVYFREHTRRKASELALSGWVKNLPDGRVEIVAEGNKEDVKKLIEFAEKGSLFARVSGLEIEWEDYEGDFRNFKVRY